MDDNMSQLKNKKIRIKHLNENDKKIGTNFTPNNNKISKFLSRKKGMFQITCVSMDNMRKMSNNNMYSEDSTDDTDDIQHVEENNINDTTHTSTNHQIQQDDSQSVTRDDYSQLFFTTNSLGCTPIIATSPQYGLAIKINDLVLNGQRLSDYHLHIDDNGVKIIGNDLKDLETSDLNQSIKVVKIESTEQFKRGRWTCMDYIEHSAIQNSNQAVADKDDNDGKQYVSTDTDDNELARKKSAELPKKSIKKSMFAKNPGRVHHDVTFADKDGKKIRIRKPSLKPRKVSEHQNNRISHVSEMRGADKIYALSSNDFIKKNKKKTKCNALYTLSTDLILQKIDNFEDKLFKKIFAVEEDQSQPNYSTNNIVYEIKHLEIKNNNTSSFDNDSSISEHLQNATEIQTVQSVPMSQGNPDEILIEVKNDQINKADINELTQLQQQINNKNSSEIASHEEKAGVAMSATVIDIPNNNNNNNEMNTVKNQVEMVEQIDKEVDKIKNDVAENPSGNEENKRSEEGAKKMEMEEYQQSEPQQQQQQQQQSVGPDPVASSSRQVNETKEESSNEEGENSSEASGADIDNKIGQAMDLVKSHLMFAVREEVEILKEKITELMDRINQLEVENSLLKANASPETLHKLSEAVPQREEQQKHLLEQRQQKQHQLQQLLLQQQIQQQQLLLLLQPSQKNKQPKFKPPQDYQKQLLENQKKLQDMQLHLNNPKHDDKNDQNQMDGKN